MPSINCMKDVLALALSLGLASCAAPAPTQKTVTGDTMMEKDSAECRAAAKQHAVQRYPHGASSPGMSPVGMGMVRDDNNRAVAEAAAYSSCMDNRGYSNSPPAK